MVGNGTLKCWQMALGGGPNPRLVPVNGHTAELGVLHCSINNGGVKVGMSCGPSPIVSVCANIYLCHHMADCECLCIGYHNHTGNGERVSFWAAIVRTGGKVGGAT